MCRNDLSWKLPSSPLVAWSSGNEDLDVVRPKGLWNKLEDGRRRAAAGRSRVCDDERRGFGGEAGGCEKISIPQSIEQQQSGMIDE